MGEGSGRGCRVGSDIWSAIAERVGSGQRFAESSWVGSQKSDPWTTLVLSHRQMNLTNHVAPFELNNIHYPPHMTSFELDNIH